MALDKLVDSTQLDTDLTSVANAIRVKGGTSAQLAFPAGFVSAIDAIPTGGGDPWELVADYTSDAVATIVEAHIPEGKQNARYYKVEIDAEFTGSEFPYWGINDTYSVYDLAKPGDTPFVFVGFVARKTIEKNGAVDASNTVFGMGGKTVDLSGVVAVESIAIKAYYADHIKAGCRIRVWRLAE
jgi:hypothetical protein